MRADEKLTAFLELESTVPFRRNVGQQQHRRVQEQEATIRQLKKEMETVVARLNEHDLEIERVSDQMQVNSPTARVVVRNQ